MVCVYCGVDLAKRENQPIYTSSLYGSSYSHNLCNICGDNEQKEIEREGTNNIPDLLALYQ